MKICCRVGINHFLFFYDELATAIKDKDLTDLKDREETFDTGEDQRNTYKDGKLVDSRKKRSGGNEKDYFPTKDDVEKGLGLKVG